MDRYWITVVNGFCEWVKTGLVLGYGTCEVSDVHWISYSDKVSTVSIESSTVTDEYPTGIYCVFPRECIQCTVPLEWR